VRQTSRLQGSSGTGGEDRRGPRATQVQVGQAAFPMRLNMMTLTFSRKWKPADNGKHDSLPCRQQQKPCLT